MDRIPVFKPFLDQLEKEAVVEALNIGWLGMGAFVGEFEYKIKEYLLAHDRYAVAVSTGHAALHLGLLISGVGPGDEVITPAFNNIADFQAIIATGAEPVFCDIDINTLCIDIEKAESLVSPRTKAIIVMDYDCLLCDHDRVEKFAAQHNIRVIHDAAHSLGSKYKGKMIGSFSDICMFSFDPVKTITCIDGGILMVKTEEEVKMLHEMRLIGMGQPASVMYQNKRAWTYDVHRLGFRYHMSNPHAAIGLAQLSKIDQISAQRREACRYYNENLREIPGVVVPKTDFEDITPFLYYIRVPEEDRDDLRSHLYDLGIDTGIHWQPGHWFSLFKNARRGDLSITDRVGKEILSLPLHSTIIQELQNRVVDGISSYFMLRANKC
jgi:dTDP-4-amino-4,6-dideoxygalactose transaminase